MPQAVAPQGWESIGKADFLTDGSRLRLASTTSEYGPGELVLGQRGSFGADVSVAGRDRVEALDVASFAEGVEQWLIRIWRNQGVSIPPCQSCT
ncbi:hypothetical protein BBK82_08160 [Lentzea guizhouensis]|uniref:Uncharacterized protein n=1 Tax=Lentzea guizhouensis TaxID=1586287 RepID=A0A1B2HE89_9PSEU|nr:hypothetical protein BBK82_08160 [Lentzea guizhouensis]